MVDPVKIIREVGAACATMVPFATTKRPGQSGCRLVPRYSLHNAIKAQGNAIVTFARAGPTRFSN